MGFVIEACNGFLHAWPLGKRALSLMEDAPSFATINSAFGRLVRLGLVEEQTGSPRYRVFAYKKYLEILSEGTEPL
jgi:hypothetical protein